jgi:phage shock protein A
VRRRKRAARERKDLQAQLAEHERVEIQLREDMARVDERVARLEHQRNVLRTRESRAGAMSAAHADDAGLLSEIDDIFERWDTKVTAAEYRADCALAGPDDLEARFVASEEAEDLRAELEELVRDEGGDETA